MTLKTRELGLVYVRNIGAIKSDCSAQKVSTIYIIDSFDRIGTLLIIW